MEFSRNFAAAWKDLQAEGDRLVTRLEQLALEQPPAERKEMLVQLFKNRLNANDAAKLQALSQIKTAAAAESVSVMGLPDFKNYGLDFLRNSVPGAPKVDITEDETPVVTEKEAVDVVDTDALTVDKINPVVEE